MEASMNPMAIGAAVLLLVGAGGTRVEAQAVASSFDQLIVLVKPGDKITVVDVAGRRAEGRIANLCHHWRCGRSRVRRGDADVRVDDERRR
jgi:hypothetical protein